MFSLSSVKNCKESIPFVPCFFTLWSQKKAANILALVSLWLCPMCYWDFSLLYQTVEGTI